MLNVNSSAHKEIESKVEQRRSQLDRLLGVKDSIQILQSKWEHLFKVIGCGDLDLLTTKQWLKLSIVIHLTVESWCYPWRTKE
jgi:hypothetical protein